MIAQKRGKNIALAGAFFQLLFAGVCLILWLWTVISFTNPGTPRGSLSALACTLLLAVGVPLWLMVAVMFYCRQLERREAIELAELAAGGGPAGSIFRREDGQELRPAAARVAFLDKWIVPIFTVLWAGLHVLIAVLLLRYLVPKRAEDLPHTAEAGMLLALTGFLAFLLSRYATGMGRVPEWRPLRAAGSYLLVNTLAVGAAVVALIAEWQGYPAVDVIVAYVPPLVQIILAAELLLNFVLDLFRPRVPGQEQRPSFDSRLFNLLAEPGKVGRSLAEAVNYQFGFEVSKTWFYQLLSRSMVPLLIFAVAVAFALTSVVVVGQAEQCVVFHWGKLDARGTLGPGIHLKWPWPIDRTERFNVGKVHEILLGAGDQRDPNERMADFVNGRELFLWTKAHGSYREQDFLVAVPPRNQEPATRPAGEPTSGPAETQPAFQARTSGQQPPPPVNIIKLVVSVQYVVDDPYKFGYTYADAAKVLECVAYREMTRYCACATLDEPVGGADANRPEAIMTYGQRRAAEALKSRIEAAVGKDGLDLGVRIVHVGFLAVHPPAEAAPSYEAVLEAERRTDEKRFEAEGEAAKTLVRVAGDPQTALELALAIQVVSRLDSLKNLAGRPAALSAKLEEYLQAEKRDIEDLDAEVEGDRLLGRLRGGAETTATLLRRKHQAHLAQLEDLKKRLGKAEALDLDARVSIAMKEADRLLAGTMGEPAARIAQAVAGRWTKELGERVRVESFERKLIAYKASPRLYVLERWLDVWDEFLPNLTKYVVGFDPQKMELRMNLEEESGAMARPTFTEEVSPRR